VDAILAVGSSAIQAAKDATTTIPIVLFTGGDPVAAGLVSSLARPEGNITGVLIAPEGSLAGKRLEMLRESVPRATRMALLVTDDPGVMLKQQISETRSAASTLGIELDVTEVRGSDYARVFAAMAPRRPQALIVGAQAVLLRDRKQIIELAAKYRLPAIYEWPRQVQDGGLMSYGANDVATYAQVASYIDRIFKGARPGDLPIWQPSRLHLVINLKTAAALGITIPQSLLMRADEVIQ
jgi:putative ABC transport system substrate-binding protein